MAKRVLVVDDDAAMRQVLTLRVKAQGYEVTGAADVVSGFAEIRKRPPDLILLDLGLPGGGGLNLLQRLQSIPSLSSIPVVVISARERVAIERETLAAGAVAVFFGKSSRAINFKLQSRPLVCLSNSSNCRRLLAVMSVSVVDFSSAG